MTMWWILAGVAVAIEMMTGTVYLLMVALGLAAGAVAAMLEFSLNVQISIASFVGGFATAGWHWKRAAQPKGLPASQNADVNLDIGGQVYVADWSSPLGTKVNYRGSQWIVRLADGCTAAPGTFSIVAVEGNTLVLKPT